MTDQEFVRALIFSAPLVCALVCLLLAVFDTGRSKHPVHRKIHYNLITTYAVIALIWLGFVLHSIARTAFIFYIPLFVPLVMFSYRMIYSAVRSMTNTGGEQRRFPWVHFISPILVSVMMLVVALTVPFERMNEIVYNPKGNAIASAVVGLCFAYNSIIYRILGIAEIWNYKNKMAGDSSDNHRLTLNLMFWLMIVEIIVLPLPTCGLLMGMKAFSGLGYLWIVTVLPPMAIYIISCHNMLTESYVILEADKQPARKHSVENDALRLSRQRVESYLDEKRPWLNPAFRITDMAEDLITNRAYISAFINKEYGMNFNRFINGYRLREAERLRGEASQNQERTPSTKLVLKAGFSNYRSYLRAKEAASAAAADETIA